MESVHYKLFIFTLISGRQNLIINLYDNHKKNCGNYYFLLSLLHFVRLAIQYALTNNFVFVFIYLGKSSGDENGAR